MKKFYLILFMFGLIQSYNHAQQDCKNIGMNLYYNKYWSREMPFADLTKQASQWLDEELKPIDLDSAEFEAVTGYPSKIPIHYQGEYIKLKRIVCLDNGGIHPSGDYVLSFEGSGDVTIEGEDIDSETIINTNRKVYAITPKKKGEIILVINHSVQDDPVRDISLMLPGTDKEADLFNPAFLEKLSPFTTIRFLNWTETNYNTIESWSERILPVYYDQSSTKGVAYEYIVALCNVLKKDLWLNTPHAANEAFIENLAKLMHDNLDSDLNTFLEYSNEVWNTNHKSYWWVAQQGSSLHPDHQYQYAYFSGKMFQTFKKNFTKGKLTRVLCGQQAWSDVIFRSAKGMDYFSFTDDYDAISCTGNIYLTDQDQVNVRNLGSNLKPEDVLAMLEKNMNSEIKTNMAKHVQISNIAQKALISYESSPYALVQYPQFASPPSYAAAIYESIYHPKMKEIYSNWIKTLFDDFHLDLMMAFVLADDNRSHYGSFGHLDNIFQETPYNPAYQALLDARCTTSIAPETRFEDDVMIYPNPASPNTTCRVATSRSIDKVQIYDIYGHLVSSYTDINLSTQDIDVSKMKSGVYLLKIILQNGNHHTSKLVLE
ncbi:MAG: T9SS type A sorting domain-containing protein [Saprospiraceae bacterium]